MTTAIDLVIFDLGRVLVRICDDWKHACELAGVELPRRAELSAAERGRVDEICGRYDCGAIGLEGFAGEIGPIFGQSAEHIIAVQQAYLRGAYPGAAELIEELYLAGVKTACLSNTAETHWRMMQDPAGANFVPLERLNWRFASFLVGCRKPDAVIYEQVERTTGVAPGSIVFFDDIEENVAAAARRGWKAHRIEIESDPIEQVRGHLVSYGILTAP